MPGLWVHALLPRAELPLFADPHSETIGTNSFRSMNIAFIGEDYDEPTTYKVTAYQVIVEG
jgi:hypothetical protein